MKILITSATSAEAHRLKSKLDTDQVILGDYIELPAFMLQSGAMIRIPSPASASYTHEMLTLCLDNNITGVYALIDDEYKTLIMSRQLFSEYGIEILNDNNEL